MGDHLETLVQRRDYLTARIAAKQSVGWEHRYDERERDALTWAIHQLTVPSQNVGADAKVL